MSQIKTLNGVQYTLPQYSDTGWGANTGNVLTQYLAAIADVTLQLSGGAFTLTAETDFGGSFGLKALYLKTETANPASAGVVRLADADTVKWRNHANAADIALSKDTSDNLQWNATKILLSGAVVNADINAAAAIAYSKLNLTGSIVNADINASAAIAYSKLSLTGSVVNADIAAAAAIALTKLASTTAYYWYAANSSGVLTPLAVTASRAVATDANGLPVASAVTATELGYVSGVTSAIQTQLNATIANPLTSNLAAGSHKLTGLAAGTTAGDSVRFEQLYYGFQAPVQGTSTTQFTTANTAYQSTNLSASITLTNSAHRVKITVTGTLASNTGTAGLLAIATINGTTNGDLSAAAGFARAETQSNGLAVGIEPCSMSYIDSPGTTSAQTYTVKIKASSGSTTAQWGTGGSTQVIILEEIV